MTGLRDALEELADDMAYDVSDAPARIRAVLAKHPVEPAGVSDEARAAGLKALLVDNGWHKSDGTGVWRANYKRAVDLVLEAAAPLMGATPVASRDKLAAVWREHTWISDESRCSCGDREIEFMSHHVADALLAAGVFRDEAEVKAEVAKRFREDAIDEAVEGNLNLTAVIRMAAEAGAM